MEWSRPTSELLRSTIRISWSGVVPTESRPRPASRLRALQLGKQSDSSDLFRQASSDKLVQTSWFKQAGSTIRLNLLRENNHEAHLCWNDFHRARTVAGVRAAAA